MKKLLLCLLMAALCALCMTEALAAEHETEIIGGYVPSWGGEAAPTEPTPAPEAPAEENETEPLTEPTAQEGGEASPADPAPAPEAPAEENETEPLKEPTPQEVGGTPDDTAGGGSSAAPAGAGEGAAPSEPEKAPAEFADVGPDKWYADAVRYVSARGIMNGSGSGVFAPAAKLTRAMAVQLLYNLEERPAVDGASPFTDVEAGKWYAPAVLWASKQGLVNGVSGDRFAPGEDVTREQLAAILFRYVKYRGGEASPSGSLGGFADAGEVSSWARDAMRWAVGVGLIRGRTPDALAPKGTATRAEVATMLMRFREQHLK